MICFDKKDTRMRILMLPLIHLIFSCSFVHGDSYCRFMKETSKDFWKTNLVATVIGYTDREEVNGIYIPKMNPTDKFARHVWLYSIAPTNYAGITFSMHSCGAWSLSDVYPTNQFFIFPAANVEKPFDSNYVRTGKENDPIIPHSTVEDYCPYRTYEKLFLFSESQIQYWISNLTKNNKRHKEEIERLRAELNKSSNDKKRNRDHRRIEELEKWITNNQSTIEKFRKQPPYFQERRKWLESQGLRPDH